MKIKDTRILVNKAQCSICGDIIQSNHRHDFKWCSCGTIAVDGGTAYLKRCGELNNYVELSEHEEYERTVPEYLEDLYRKSHEVIEE